ncbi:MAG TPA: amidohydrolase family protein [Stellaceae bacterium]|nr:amidohydrolase family protein [Stellaceae bacterium]
MIITGGRIVDPANGRDEIADIAFADGKVAAIGRDLPRAGAETIDARGKIVTPGLIDLHTHVYWGGTSLGVDAAEVARKRRHRDVCRCRELGTRQFSRLSPSRHRAVAGAHRPDPQSFARRHLCLLDDGDGRGVRRSAAPGAARLRARHQRQS